MQARSIAAGLAPIIWALGLTQIVGYGTLYYAFSILAPAMAKEFAFSQEWAFGALSAALFAGGLFAPVAGRWADRFGAGRVMTAGSIAAALALAACALAPGRITFVASLLAMELASSFVLYSAAFVAIVQIGAPRPQRSITHLTLIAGFASTLFWPLTVALHDHLSWREVYLIFAALNLALCLPIHAQLMHLSRRPLAHAPRQMHASGPMDHGGNLDPRRRQVAFFLMLTGFAVEGFVLSAILIHMVPLTTALGLGSAGLLVSALFGPAQVASRLVNMLFGGRLAQAYLAILAASLLAVGLCALLLTTPWLAGAVLFVILFGLGSGLASIVGGTLPLELFGREGYGARLGWVSAARQFTSSFAPFALAWLMMQTSVANALWLVAAVSAAGMVAFVGIAAVKWRAGRLRERAGRACRGASLTAPDPS